MDYNNTKIYKIVSDLGDKVYIGTTTKQYLSQRMQGHRANYKTWQKTGKRRCTSFEIFDEYGVENCKIVLIELFPCTTKDEQSAREYFHICCMDCVNKKKQSTKDPKTIVQCNRCNREVLRLNFEKHQETALCKKRFVLFPPKLYN
jgi:hypothetical protein